MKSATRPLRLAPADSLRRTRVADALRGCSMREQLVLVLLLYERLTPAEAAEALGLDVRRVERAYRAALGGLRRALRARQAGRREHPTRASRAIARRAVMLEARLRRAA